MEKNRDPEIKEVEDKVDNEGVHHDEDEPKRKLRKLANGSTQSLTKDSQEVAELAMNESLLQKDFITTFQNNWSKSQDYTDNKSTQIYGNPFQISIMSDFLKDSSIINSLVKEMVSVEWSRKQMDLYEFYQSTDLSNIGSPYLSKFFDLLQTSIKPWVEELCNVKLNYVSASCSMYNSGDYLLVHDDLLKDRQVAFIFYISPWEGVSEWTDSMGGCLEIFKTDENCFPCFPVVHKIKPKNNQFAFFKVGSKSFHQVGEVTSFDYPRLTINGWFHGSENTDVIEDSLRPFVPPVFESPIKHNVDLSAIINSNYLKDGTKRRIQKHIEDNSEICLEEFVCASIYNELTEELKSEDLRWQEKGPANSQSYQVLDIAETSGTLRRYIDMLRSNTFCNLLREYTDLDLAGVKAKHPSLNIEIQRWKHGSYTVLGDGSLFDENTLDLVMHINPAESAGIITYLSPNVEEEDPTDDEMVLLTIEPKSNALSIVYRCEGTTKFTKYVSKLSNLQNGPVYIIYCSYKE